MTIICMVTIIFKCSYYIGELVAACIELVSRDLKDLISLFYEKLNWLLVEEEEGNNSELFAGWSTEEVEAVLEHFKAFYDERYSSASIVVVKRCFYLHYLIYVGFKWCTSILPKPKHYSKYEIISSLYGRICNFLC